MAFVENRVINGRWYVGYQSTKRNKSADLIFFCCSVKSSPCISVALSLISHHATAAPASYSLLDFVVRTLGYTEAKTSGINVPGHLVSL